MTHDYGGSPSHFFASAAHSFKYASAHSNTLQRRQLLVSCVQKIGWEWKRIVNVNEIVLNLFGLSLRIDRDFPDRRALYGKKNRRPKFRIGDETVSHRHPDRDPAPISVGAPLGVARQKTPAGEYEELAVYLLVGMRKISTIDDDEFPDPPSEPTEPENIKRRAAFVIAPDEVPDIAEWSAILVSKGQIIDPQMRNPVRKHFFRYRMKSAIEFIYQFDIVHKRIPLNL
ncbi:MAG TPA: hypothetical protein VMS01_08855 [Stellaceae bacterium]|nr:hypothetical protein [Stellaceae bacterium]